jgi:hypothetical protein
MKYIKRLNIDFDNWDELNNECIYLIFRSVNRFYIGYIINNKVYLLNDYRSHNLRTIDNINQSFNDDSLIFYYSSNNILYKDLKQTDFYKNNNILIVGVDIYKKELKKLNFFNTNNCYQYINLKT